MAAVSGHHWSIEANPGSSVWPSHLIVAGERHGHWQLGLWHRVSKDEIGDCVAVLFAGEEGA